MRVTKNKERLVDALVKSILIYNDRIVFNLTYKDEPVEIPTKDEIIDAENSSDIKALASPILNKDKHSHSWVFFFLLSTFFENYT
jgi:hypothetical protein